MWIAFNEDRYVFNVVPTQAVEFESDERRRTQTTKSSDGERRIYTEKDVEVTKIRPTCHQVHEKFKLQTLCERKGRTRFRLGRDLRLEVLN